MTSSNIDRVAARIVRAIVKDFTDRRGLRQQWDEIDDDVQAEILAKWQELVAKELARG